MKKKEPDYILAHKYSSHHREILMKSDSCGCFHCFVTFKPSEIAEWIDEVNGVETTALCPCCGIDSVIGSASGFPIEKEFLKEMQKHWFREEPS